MTTFNTSPHHFKWPPLAHLRPYSDLLSNTDISFKVAVLQQALFPLNSHLLFIFLNIKYTLLKKCLLAVWEHFILCFYYYVAVSFHYSLLCPCDCSYSAGTKGKSRHSLSVFLILPRYLFLTFVFASAFEACCMECLLCETSFFYSLFDITERWSQLDEIYICTIYNA